MHTLDVKEPGLTFQRQALGNIGEMLRIFSIILLAGFCPSTAAPEKWIIEMTAENPVISPHHDGSGGGTSPKSHFLIWEKQTRTETEGESLLLTVTTQNGAKSMLEIPLLSLSWHIITYCNKGKLHCIRLPVSGHSRSHPFGDTSIEQ